LHYAEVQFQQKEENAFLIYSPNPKSFQASNATRRHLGKASGLSLPIHLNEWAATQNCTFTGHREIKTACIETAVKYDKNR